MFFENHVETEKEMKDSQRIMFVELPADKIDDKEAGNFQSVSKLVMGLLSSCLLKIRSENSNISAEKHSIKLKTWFHT